VFACLSWVIESIVTFIFFGGLPIGLVLLGLIWIGLKHSWLLLLTITALAYAGLVIFWVSQAAEIETRNIVGKTIAVQFHWGSFYYLTLLIILISMTKLIRTRNRRNRRV
jgi:hypothetical protein